MTRCAECGAPGADRKLRDVLKCTQSELLYCRNCYEKMASRIMRPTDRAYEDFRERLDERT